MKLNLILIAAVAAGLAGCASTGGAGQAKSPANNMIAISNPAPAKTFTVLKQTPTGKQVSRQDVLIGLAASIRQHMPQSATVNAAPTGDAINAGWYWTMALNHNNLSASYPVSIVETAHNYAVTINCPASMKSDIVDYSITGIQQWNTDSAAASLTSACKTADVSIPFNDAIKGEINNNFSDVGVFANFQRKLKPVSADAWRSYAQGEKVTALDIEKSKKFLIPTSNGDAIAAIAVFPYRNGAKVTYAFNYRYAVLGNGTSNYSSAEVDAIRKTISDIAND